MEYYLNTIFNNPVYPCVFQQPSSVTRSSIYIQTNAIVSPFFVGYTESESSDVIYDNTESCVFVESSDVAIAQYAFTINIPINLFDALVAQAMSNITDANKLISGFVDKLNIANLNYNIQTY